MRAIWALAIIATPASPASTLPPINSRGLRISMLVFCFLDYIVDWYLAMKLLTTASSRYESFVLANGESKVEMETDTREYPVYHCRFVAKARQVFHPPPSLPSIKKITPSEIFFDLSF